MPKYKFADLVYNITEKRLPVAGDEVFYIGLEHLDSGKLKVTRWGSKVAIKGEKLVMKKGDILFGRRNTYLRRVAIAPHDGIFSAHGMIFRPKKEVINEDFFPFFIASDYFMDEAIRISVGSLSPTVNWGELKELEFEIPSLEQQKKLAKILVAANQTKENYEELLLKTDELVKSQFIEMFKDNSEEVLLKDYVWFQEGPGVRSVDFRDEGTILLTGSNINNNKISFGYNSDRYISDELANGKYAHFICKKGDILVVASAIDPQRFDQKVCVVDVDNKYCLNTGIIRFRPNEEFMLKGFFQAFLKTDYFKGQVSKEMRGVCQMHFGPSHLKSMKLLLPKSFEAQKQFVLLSEQTDKSKVNLQKGLKRLENTKNMIIQSFSNERRIKNAYV